MENTSPSWKKDEVGRRNPNAEHNWELLNLETLSFDRVTVFDFSGNGTITNKQANGSAKFPENDLELLFKDKTKTPVFKHVDILGVKYSRKSLENKAGELSEESIDLISNAFVRLLTDEKGQRLNTNEACRKMSRVVFKSYCAGDTQIQKVVYNLDKKLKAVGYTWDEIISINNASMHISFAPLNHFFNLIPSVRVVSSKDDIASDHLDLLLENSQFNLLDGVYLHYENAGTLYNKERAGATAGTIHIITGNLLNSFESSQDEHNSYIVSRDKDWNVSPMTIDGVTQASVNADCVSQMMAWALCRGVENGINNFYSKEYIPNNFSTELTEELKSIKESYSPFALANNPKRMTIIRKTSFDAVRSQKVAELAKSINTFKPEKEVVLKEFQNVSTFEEALLVCEKYNYYYADETLAKLDFLTNDQKQILYYALEKKQKEILKESISTMSWPELCKMFKDAKNYDELLSLSLIAGNASFEVLPEIAFSPDNERNFAFTIPQMEEILSLVRKNRAKYDSQQKFQDKFTQIEEELKACDKSFGSIAKIFGAYDYFCTTDLVYVVRDFISPEQENLLLQVAKIKNNAIKEKENLIKFPTFEEMVSSVNNLNSFEEIYDYFKPYNFVGIEYILPEVFVLTDTEKESLLQMAGKPVEHLPEFFQE